MLIYIITYRAIIVKFMFKYLFKYISETKLFKLFYWLSQLIFDYYVSVFHDTD